MWEHLVIKHSHIQGTTRASDDIDLPQNTFHDARRSAVGKAVTRVPPRPRVPPTAQFCWFKTYMQKLCNVMLLIKLNLLTFNAFLYIRLVILLV